MTRILGVGSPFGADRLAWEALEYLSGAGLGDVELISLDRPGSGLLSYFNGVDNLILLDALAVDDRPGSVSLLDPDRLERLSSGTSTHGFGVAQAIALARQLDQLPARLHVVGLHAGADLARLPPLETGALERLVRSLL